MAQSRAVGTLSRRTVCLVFLARLLLFLFVFVFFFLFVCCFLICFLFGFTYVFISFCFSYFVRTLLQQNIYARIAVALKLWHWILVQGDRSPLSVKHFRVIITFPRGGGGEGLLSSSLDGMINAVLCATGLTHWRSASRQSKNRIHFCASAQGELQLKHPPKTPFSVLMVLYQFFLKGKSFPYYMRQTAKSKKGRSTIETIHKMSQV